MAVDSSGWPVVVVTIDEADDARGAEAMVGELDALVARGERIGLVFDYHGGRPEAVAPMSAWLAARIGALERVVAGAVTVVAPDAVDRVRSMIEGGMFSMPFPSWATATVDEGRDWVSRQLAPAGEAP